MLLYVVRHGEPDYVTDTLLERGKLQAEAVGKRLVRAGITQIYSSPMGRAKETAAPACRMLNLPCHIEEWAKEIEQEVKSPYPDGVLKSVSLLNNIEFRKDGRMDLLYDQGFDCPGINQSHMKEAVEYITENGRDFLTRLGYREENGIYRIINPNEERVALFCHAGLMRAWMSVLLHIPIHTLWSSFSVTHTGITVFEFKNEPEGFTAPRCLAFSDTSHLYADGLDLRHCNKFEV